MRTRSVSAFSTVNTFNTRSISGFHTARGSNIRSIWGIYIARYCWLEYYSEYFTRTLKYFGIQYSRYSEYSKDCRFLYCGYCLYSSICIAHTPRTRRVWAISTARTPSTLSIQAVSSLILSVLGVRKILDTPEYTTEYRVHSEHLCILSAIPTQFCEFRSEI